MKVCHKAYLLAFGVGLCLSGELSAATLERISLATGFDVECVRHQALSADRVRLFFTGDSSNYMDVASSSIRSVSTVEEILKPKQSSVPSAPASQIDIATLISDAGRRHRIDSVLLTSVIRAESAGKTHAVSRTGAQGLMQLMPATASQLGVQDAFAADQNIGGGTTYLDQLLTRYRDNLPLALAAYNAGPAAVDRYHGVPPYRETRAYVARVIREFNRRKLMERASAKTGANPQ